MPVNEALMQELEHRLAPLEGVKAKKMFGGVGVFKDKIMFAMIDAGDVIRFRCDERTAQKYIDAGMDKMRMHKGGKERTMPYWQVPDTVLDSDAQLLEWAAEAFQVALDSK